MQDLSGKTVIVLLSGGLDSMVCAGLAREAGARIVALTVDYNQRHRVELDSAARIATAVGAAEHIVLPLDLRRFGGSALTADIDVPKDGVGEDIPVTYVPARNLIFLSLTLGLAEARRSQDATLKYERKQVPRRPHRGRPTGTNKKSRPAATVLRVVSCGHCTSCSVREGRAIL